MAYTQIDGAYFEETANGLNAVTDRNVVAKLKAGQLPATKRSSKDTSGTRFAGQSGGTLPSMAATGNTELPQTENRVSAFQNFSAALNKAVTLARNQRNSADLDLLGKTIKPGSVSASSFSSLLADINTASNQFSEPLVTDALSVAKMEEERVSAERNSIRDLALSLATQGISQETIQGLLAAPTMDVALPIATAALSSKASKGEVQQIGSKLVRVMPDGAVNVIFDGDASPGGGSGAGMSTAMPSQTFEQFIAAKEQKLQQSINPANYDSYRAEYEALSGSTVSGTADVSNLSPLAAAVMQNPDQYTDLTAGDKAKIMPELSAAGFKFPRKLGAEQQKAASIADSGLLALQEMENEITTDTGAIDVGMIQSSNPWSSFSNYKRTVVDAISRLSSGAALTDAEVKFYNSQVPGAFDSEDVIKQKQTHLAVFFSGVSGNPITLKSDTGDVYVFENLYDQNVRADVRDAIRNGYQLIDF